jgi:hypothetical protein
MAPRNTKILRHTSGQDLMQIYRGETLDKEIKNTDVVEMM